MARRGKNSQKRPPEVRRTAEPYRPAVESSKREAPDVRSVLAAVVRSLEPVAELAKEIGRGRFSRRGRAALAGAVIAGVLVTGAAIATVSANRDAEAENGPATAESSPAQSLTLAPLPARSSLRGGLARTAYIDGDVLVLPLVFSGDAVERVNLHWNSELFEASDLLWAKLALVDGAAEESSGSSGRRAQTLRFDLTPIASRSGGRPVQLSVRVGYYTEDLVYRPAAQPKAMARF